MNELIQDQQNISDISDLEWVSRKITERLSASGDTTGIPYYHFRWKKKWLADYVAWPTDAEQVSTVLKYAWTTHTPVIARGGGTCYYGSSSPTRGGIVIDTKSMDKILEVNSQDLWVHVQSGIVWEVLDRALAKQDLALRVMPQSAPASTLAGWLAIGGKAGIGTPKFGNILENTLEMTVVRPNGAIEAITGKEMETFYGTSGIAGIVISLKLKIRQKPERTDGVMYAFGSINRACKIVEEISQHDIKPVYLRITDPEYEWRSQTDYPARSKRGCFVLVTYDGMNSEVEQGLTFARDLFEKAGGTDIGRPHYEKSWNDRFIIEMKLKLEVPTLSMQNFWIEPCKIGLLTNRMYEIADKYHINSCYYLVLGAGGRVRFCVFAPSDHRYWMHFMSGKSMLHQLVKLAYRYGAKLYTIGLQNSVYLKKFQADDYARFKEIRAQWDPYNIMNPDKLTHSNLTYSRINVMFTMNGFIRRLSVLLRLAKNILQVPRWVKEGA